MKDFTLKDKIPFNEWEYFKQLVSDLGIEIDATNYNSAKLMYNGLVIYDNLDLQEDDDSGEFTNAIEKIKEYFKVRVIELHLMKAREKTCRPIALPENLTVSEFNWLLNFLKEQRKKFEEAPQVEVEPLKTLDF